MALPRKRRLNRSAFKEAGRKGAVRHSPLFSLRFVKKSKEISRFSVVVSSKSARKATDRNRLRRRAYEIVRKEAPKEGYAAILYIKPAAARLAAARFRESLEAYLRESFA